VTTSPTATASPLEPIHLNRPIDPTVDCVFKALFGHEDNKALLINFLNSVLRPATPILDVTLVNPTNDQLRLDDKETAVDVRACDASGATFQVDVQVVVHPALAERMLFNWATIYNRQLKHGEKYDHLKPLTSIWVLRRNLWKIDMLHHHHFEVWDRNAGLTLSNHFSIHTLELGKWESGGAAPEGEALWMQFLRDARTWQTLPALLADLPHMRHAMTVLKRFSDDDIEHLNYLSRLDRERVQQALEDDAKEKTEAIAEMERKLSKTEQELSKTEQELSKTEQELSKTEALVQSEAAARADAERLADQQASHRDSLRRSLQALYNTRFGPLPDAIVAALDTAQLAHLTAWLPHFATASAPEILALITSTQQA
jgi:predicted transposase/invertase (TIGR01784 family)